MKVLKWQKWLLAILLLLLPYHTMLTYVIGDTIPVIRFWKEGIIGILFILFLIKIFQDYRQTKSLYKPNVFERILIVYIIIEFIYICISNNMYQAVYIGRIYFMPLLLVPVVRCMEFTENYFQKLLKLVMANTALLSLWGLIQCQFLGDGFLMKLGYPTTTKWGPLRLNDEFYIARLGNFQRLVSTFAAPNTCGLYLAIVLLVTLFMYKKLNINKVFVSVTVGLMAAALIVTFSRTAWIATCAGLMIYSFNMIKWTKKKLLCVIKATGMILLAFIILDGIFLSFDISMAIIHLVVSTINGNDSSVNGHIDSLVASVENIFNYPLGMGMGENGPRALVFMKKPNLTESAYFLMTYEVGIIGSIVYFGSYVKVLYDNIREFRRRRNSRRLFISSVILIIMTGFISLPFVQDFEILVYVFVVMALQYNLSVISDMYKEEPEDNLQKKAINKAEKLEKKKQKNKKKSEETISEKCCTQAVILAGGLGTRLKSVVNDRPKPMALVNEKPFLEYVLEELKKNGITDIIFAVGYKGSMVEDYFGDGSRFHLKIQYSYEDGQLGTAGAIKNAAKLIKGKSFYVLNGDTYYKIDYGKLAELNEKNNSIMTLVLRRVEDISRYGRAVLTGDRLTAFNEKADSQLKQNLNNHSKKKGKKKSQNSKQASHKVAGTINGGIYYMTTQIFDYIPDGKVSLENEVIPELLKQDCYISGIVNEGYFIDIGIPEDYFKFQEDINNLIDSI